MSANCRSYSEDRNIEKPNSKNKGDEKLKNIQAAIEAIKSKEDEIAEKVSVLIQEDKWLPAYEFAGSLKGLQDVRATLEKHLERDLPDPKAGV